MKKKFISCFFLAIVGLTSIFANFDYRFDLVSFDPLHKEYFADVRRPELSINYLFYTEGYPDRVIQDEYVDGNTTTNKIKYWELDMSRLEPLNQMIHLKIGETASLARSTFTFDHWLSPISFDFSMQGLLQEFFLGGFDDSIGYDGIYFFGGTFRIGDVFSMRIGNHHYCSHYGDAILKGISKTADISNRDYFWLTYKYIRMDAFVLGFSIEPTSNFRLYGELNYPPRDIQSIRPDMFAPNWVTRNGIQINDYPDWYNARIVNVGFEYSHHFFKKLGKTTIGYDLHMYEEGKVIYNHFENGASDGTDSEVSDAEDSNIYFDKDAPWEVEHNIRISQELNDTVSLEFTYHNGRSPFNNFFFQHTEIFGVGARVNPKSTVTLFDTE